MKADREYIEAHEYFREEFNKGNHYPTVLCALGNIARVCTFGIAIKEAENTVKRLKALQKNQMKFVIEAYRKETME